MSFEITQERPTPKLWLAKPNKTVIQRINGIENLSGNFNFMNQTTLSFNINSHLFDEMIQEQRKNPVIPKIRNKYLIKFEYNGQEDWLVINDKTNLAQEKDFITVNAEYIGSELNTKRIGDIEEIGTTIGSLMNKFLSTSALNWSVKYIDPKLASIKREYNLTDASVSTLLEAISTQTDAVVVFHNKDRQLSFIHRDNAGKFRGLKVKETTYLKSFRDQEVSSDLITRLVLFGNEGLTINGINPAGTSYIEDFSYYMKPFERDSRRNVIRHSDYMSDELCHALLDYQEYFNTKKDEYENLSEDYNKLIKEQLEEDLKLSEISATLRNLEERNEILKPRGAYTEKQIRGNTGFSALHNTYYIMVVKNEGSLARVTFGDQEQLVMPNEYAYFKMKTPPKNKSDVGESHLSYTLKVTSANPNLVAGFSTSSEEDFREEDVKELDKKYNVFKYRELYATQYPIVVAVNKKLEEYNQNRKNINDSLSAQNFFTKELLEEREQFVNWGVWREENHTDAKALLEDGMKQLKEKNNVVRTTSVDIVDFIQSLAPEDRKNWSKLKAGDKIRFSSDTYDADLEAFISDLSINFDSHEVTLTLSDIIDLHDKSRGVANQLASFMSTANQVNLQKSMIDENAGKTNKVIALLEAEWDANKKRILAGNETVDIGSHGIKIVSPTHPNEMLMAVAGVIAISDDYGETFKQAINTRGVVAERLIGKALIGTELVMENESGTFRFDDDGVTINAAHFHLVADDGEDYFDNLMQSIEESFVTYEERIKADIKAQEESFNNEIKDVSDSLQKYTNSLLDALADGMLSQQEINSLKLQLNMLEADYAQVRRRVIPMLQNQDLTPEHMEVLYVSFNKFEEDYTELVNFIMMLEKPTEVDTDTINRVKDLVVRFKPSIEELISLVELSLENTQQNRIANAEYNSRTFAENLVHDLEDEMSDLTDALDGFDLGFKGALADGVLDMIERANISDNLLRLESEKEDVDNRYDVLVTHEHLKNTSQRTKFQSSKKDYDLAYNKLIEQINFILAREKFTPEMLNEYTIRYKKLGETFTVYSATYEKTVEFVQNQYADTKLGQAQLYADGLKREVDADIKDVADNIADFEADVYGAFADGIITERERARLKIHHDMLEKEKSDVIERYNTIITNQYLQGFYDTENLVRARSEYGEIHANLLLSLESSMIDNVITKEEADLAMRQFGEYVEKLTVFSRELELGIAAIGESKAVYQTEEELKNYISLNVFNDKIAQMQAELDGHIMTWYYDHAPSLTNIPAKDWTTNVEKDSHLGDLFYHQTTGKAYRFMKQGSTYKWELIKDTEVTKALKDAQDAIDLADSKRRVFVTTPKAPYDIGDLWIKSDGELMRARTAKDANGVFSEVDWIVATKYTDDTKANAVANQLNDFKTLVNTEFEDLSGALTAFRTTVEGVFKDGIVEEYELKILQTQQQSLDREKADVDALYNQLLGRPNLTSLESSTLVSKYNSFNSTHNTLKTTITNVIADGKITEKEYNDTINALNNYPIELQKIKTYMNELIQSLIEKAQNTAEDAIQRFDTWRSSSFEVDTEKIASRVGESTWEEKYLPTINEKVSGIGSENLVPFAHAVKYRDKWRAISQGSANLPQIIAPETGNSAYDNTTRVYVSGISVGDYFGVRSGDLTEDILEGETYSISFKTTNHASSDTGMTYTYLMNNDTSKPNQILWQRMTTEETTRLDGVIAYHHKLTFKANFSGAAHLMIATRSTSDVASQFHFYDVILVRGSQIPAWSASSQDAAKDAIETYNTHIKSNYSTTTQTKELLGNYVTSTEMQGNLDKIATGYGKYLVSNTQWKSLKEAGGSAVSDTFSYEVTARRTSNSNTLFVAVFNSRGTGKGWDREILEQKGSTSWHPEIYNTSGGDIRVRLYGGSTAYEVEVVYTKYAGSFTNLSKTSSMIEQKAEEINSEVSKKVGNDEIISRINQSAEKVSIDADKIDLTAGSNLKLAVDNALRGGSAGVNLIEHTDFWINYDDFERTHVVSNTDETLKQSIILNTGFGKGWVRFKRASGALSYMWTRRSGRNYFSITKGRTYTFSVLAATRWNNELNYVHIRGENSPDVTQTLHGTSSDVTRTRERIGTVNGRGVYKHTYTFKADFSTNRGLMIFGLNNSSETSNGFYLSEWKLEEGDVATPYQERLTGNNIISQINADETSMVISSSKVSITADDINIDGKTIQIGSNPAITELKSDVSSASGLASTAKTQADAARVGSNIANSINKASTSVRITGDHINLTGNVTFESIDSERKGLKDGTTNVHPNILSNWGMTSISGGNIQTDQMTAKRLNIVRDDGVAVTNNGRLKNDFIVASFSPNFMSQPRADGGNASWDIFYQRGQWWTFNKYENGYNRTDPRTFNAYSFNHSARYLMIEMAVNSPSNGTGLFIEVSEFSTPSGVTSFGAVSRGWTKNEANGGYYTFQIDLGKPSFKRRNFYLKAWASSQGTNASVAQFRILRMTQNDDSWY